MKKLDIKFVKQKYVFSVYIVVWNGFRSSAAVNTAHMIINVLIFTPLILTTAHYLFKKPKKREMTSEARGKLLKQTVTDNINISTEAEEK